MNFKLGIKNLTLIGLFSVIMLKLEGSCLLEGCTCFDFTETISIGCYNKNGDSILKRNASYGSSAWIMELYFMNYAIETIPDDIFSGLRVNRIIFSNSSISLLNANAFRGITKLDEFNFDGQITAMDSNTFQPVRNSLKIFELSRACNSADKLTSFQAAMSSLQYLDHLALEQCSLSYFDKEWLKSFPSLRSLSLTGNNLNALNDVAFQHVPKLNRLFLKNNKISNLDAIVKALTSIELQSLDLDGNQLKTIEAKHFESLASLLRIEASGNLIEKIDPDTFSRNRNLSYIKLSNNYLRTTFQITNLPFLIYYDMINQNGKLMRIEDYAFERINENASPISIYLSQNENVEFGNKLLCSRVSNSTNINRIKVDSSSFRKVNRCIFTQARQLNVNNLTIDIDAKQAEKLDDICNCENKLFFAKYRIKLEGRCLDYLKTLICNSVPFVDDCPNRKEYFCNNTNINPDTFNSAAFNSDSLRFTIIIPILSLLFLL
jgi:hypothetical protein